MDFTIDMTDEKFNLNGVPLKSVDCVLDKHSGWIYPMLADGTTDLNDSGRSLLYVTEEWVDSLSEEDMLSVLKVVNGLGIKMWDNYTGSRTIFLDY